jgi:hypothetical protein
MRNVLVAKIVVGFKEKVFILAYQIFAHFKMPHQLVNPGNRSNSIIAIFFAKRN